MVLNTQGEPRILGFAGCPTTLSSQRGRRKSMNSAGRQDSVRDITEAQRRGRRGGDPRGSVLQGHQAEGPVTRRTLFGDQQGLRGVDVAGSRWVPRWRSEGLGGEGVKEGRVGHMCT